MELRILGSGNCDQSPSRISAGYLLRTQGKTFLMDAGPGTLTQLSRYGVPVGDIDEIFITHFHVDHISDLPAILFTRKHCSQADPEKELTIHGPEGLEKDLSGLRQAFGRQIEGQGLNVRVIEHPVESPTEEEGEETKEGGLSDTYSTGLITVRTMPMRHSLPAVGYRFEVSEEPGSPPIKSLTYSGDTEPCNEIILLAMETDCLLMEATTSDENPVPGHTTTSQAGAVANKAKAKSLMLTHISPENDETDMEKTASQFFSGIVIKVRDGMLLTV